MNSFLNYCPQNVYTLRHLASKTFARNFIKTFKDIALKGSDSEQGKFSTILRDKMLKCKINEFKEYITNLPIMLHEEVYVGILTTIDEYYQSHLYSEKEIVQETFSLITEAVTCLKIKVFYENMVPEYLCRFLYPHMHNMTNLRHLIMNIKLVVDCPKFEDIMVKSVSNMKQLESMVLSFYCSDKIIKAIQENCKHFKELNSLMSMNVTDESISYLINCTSLEQVFFSDTSITIPGYIRLLTNHTSLNVILTPTVMTVLMRKLSINNFHLECTKLIIQVTSSKDVSLIPKVFPKLQSLMMQCARNTDIEYESLISLKDLQCLKLMYTNFEHISALLDKLGKNIINLEMISVYNIDVVKLGQLCPKLNKLILRNCIYADITNYEYSNDFKNINNLFKSVESLSCTIMVPEKTLIFLLANCINVTDLKICDIHGALNDKNILKILTFNSFKRLKMLNLGPNIILSKSSLDHILNTCMNLKELNGLYNCQQLTSSDANQLIKAHKFLQYT